MKCPIDSATLVMSERGGVEIDYCPECRGVWLDRGELDKIIDRAEAEVAGSQPAAPVAAPQQQRYAQPRDDRDQGYDDRGRDYDTRDKYRSKKKESWISDLFG